MVVHFIFATQNKHKVKEAEQILGSHSIRLRSLKELGFHQEIEEGGTTLLENAWIKSNLIYKKYGGNVVAEDTGLEISFLNNAPGVNTARYAGQGKDADDNMEKVLNELKNSPDRSAQFRTILAVWFRDKEYSFEGIVRGKICKKRMGTGGFGYDPIFIPDGFTQSFGQLHDEVKKTISHRALAFEKFKSFVDHWIGHKKKTRYYNNNGFFIISDS